MKFITTTIVLILLASIASAQKPKVWIYTDMSDKTIPGNNAEGTVNDPDDISAMAGYILMSNEFNTVGIVVASTHRSQHKTSGNQATWATNYFGPAYAADLPGLNANIGGYPDGFTFQQSCIKVSAEKFSNSKNYTDLSGYSTVKSLLDYVSGQSDTVNVIIWGSTTEPAIFVKHCLSTGKADQLKKVRFIAHWTNSSIWQGSDTQPWKVANCNEDLTACNYLKDRAYARDIDYYECGAIGQNGVMGGVSGEAYFNQFRVGQVGKIFREGKYAYNKVDWSDAATYWVLLGGWGVNLSDINPNGTNPKATEQGNSNKFKARSKAIHDELLRRARASQTSSLLQSRTDENIKIYLVGKQLYVELLDEYTSSSFLRLYSMSGQLLMQKQISGGMNVQSVFELNGGFYLAEVSSQKGKYVQKFIVY